MLVHAPPTALHRHWDAILGTTQWLLDIQNADGNWSHKASRHMLVSSRHSEDDVGDLVQYVRFVPPDNVVILLRRHISRKLVSWCPWYTDFAIEYPQAIFSW